MRRMLKDLVGKIVVGANGRLIGNIVDFGIESDLATISSLMLKVDSKAVTDLGLSKPLWKSARVEVPSSLVAAAHDVVILKVNLQEFADTLKTAVPDEGHEAPKTEKHAPPAGA